MREVRKSMTSINEACSKAFEDYKVEALHKARDIAQQEYEKANLAYLDARDAYHKVYRKLWYGDDYPAIQARVDLGSGKE